MKRLIVAVGIFLMLDACSVGLALRGESDPDLRAVTTGATRADVETQLGKPVRSVPLEHGGTEEAYAYQQDNEPSIARAFGHALVDLVTLGIWEVAGTPMERDRERRYHLAVQYDADGRVTSVRPVEKPEDLEVVTPAEPPAKTTVRPIATKPASPAMEMTPAPIAATPPATAAVEEGRYRIQLAAYRSQAGAVREAARLRGKWPELFERRVLVVEEKKLRRRGTYFRVQLGGFATLGDARATCKLLKAGDQPCFPVRRQ